MAALTPDMIRLVLEQRLGFVATVREDGTPNLSPKGTTTVFDDDLVFADLDSPGTVRNLLRNPALEINVVDQLSRKGYRFAGTGALLTEGARFHYLRQRYRDTEGFGDEVATRLRAIIAVKLRDARALTSPAYALGHTEAELRAAWRTRHLAADARRRP